MYKEMTREEFYEKYGEVEVIFSHYYKYWFYYKAVLADGNTLVVGWGGDSNNIYRFELANNEINRVCDLYPDQGCVYDSCKNSVEGFYDY